MKRFMLTTTAALTLSAPAFAQSQTETTVMNALVENGYEASAINALSDAEVSELFLVITSEDETAIDRTIAGFDIGSAAGAIESDDSGQLEIVADRALVEAGYPEGTVVMLDDTEVSELYTAASGGDQTEVNRVIETLSFGMADDTLDVTTSADRFVAASLQSRGVDATIVNGLSQAEMSDLYIALTSGDETEIERRLSTLES